MIKTRNNIYLDLKYSDYKIKYDKLELHFSSKLYKYKFQEKAYNSILNLNSKFINKGFSFNLDLIALIILYSEIEKRGFYITYENKGVIEVWQNKKEVSLGLTLKK